MPPRLPVKRRSESEHDRAQKKGGKAEPTYDTYDEALEGGVEAEEKGERYKDGEKAQRFYEQAAELYAKAFAFDDNAYDAAYNLGRVWFILASQFYLPPATLDCYSSSMQMFQKALKITRDPMCKNEAAFNLAQTLNATADAVEEYATKDTMASSREQGKELREGAAWLLNTVIQAQVDWVQGHKDLAEDKAAKEAVKAHQDSMEVDSGAKDGMEVDKPEGEEATEQKKETEDVYPSNAPTPDALVDSLLLEIEVGVSLWDYTDPPAPPSDAQQEAMRGLLSVAREFGGPGRQAEIDLAECKVLLAVDSAMYDIVRDSIKPGSGVENAVAMAAKAVERVLVSLDTQPADDDTHVRADVLETLAEAETSHATRLHTFLLRGEGNADMAATAWSQLSAAAGHLSTAAKLPVGFTTPREFKPNLYLSLLRNTLARARLTPFNETAASNIQKLLDNCAAYAGKASDAVGWKFAKLPRENDPQPNPFFAEPLVVPEPAGWDMEMLARDIQLEMLRVCYFASTGIFGPSIDKDLYVAAATAIVEGIISVPAGTRRLMPSDIRRYVNGIEDHEGKLAPEGEDAWWANTAQRILRNIPVEEEMDTAEGAVVE